MKLILLVLLACIFCLSAKAQVMLKFKTDSLSAFIFSGGDEFNAPQLDEVAWKNGLGGRRVLMNQDLAFSQKNVEQKDGLIKFISTKHDSLYTLYAWEIDSSFLKKEKMELKENTFLAKYSAGGIVSKNKFHYGYYEISFKVEEGRGVWPAFWFYGGNKNEEIDIFELKCEKNDEIHVDTHCPYGCDKGYKNNLGFKTNWGGWLPVSYYLHEGFNVMALEWKENELIWYVNGFPLAYFKGAFPNPMNLFLNTSVAKDGGAFKPGPDESTVWPNTYSVDYFRVWTPVTSMGEIVLKRNDNFVSSAELTSDKFAVPEKKRGLMYRKKELNKIDGTLSLSVSSSNQLSLIVLGKLKDKGTSILIRKGTTDSSFNSFEKEIKMDLEPGLNEFEVIIITANKQYSQKIRIEG